MKKYVIVIMGVFWTVLLVGIIWNGTDGKWGLVDEEKIGKLEIAKYTDQIMVVSVHQEETVLCFYEKQASGEWELLLETEALIGKNGLGKRREGDLKTPVGTYRFVQAFGILEDPGTKMEYITITEDNYWVDDSGSKYYNQFIRIDEVKKDWESAEHIVEYGEAYHYVLATSYNENQIPGAGSAVFLHCSTTEMEYTAGCVAVPEFFMKRILEEVEPQCVLIIDDAGNIMLY